MNRFNIDFITYCIGNLARRLGLSQQDVYNRLKSSGILYGYIVPSYDVLHTFSKEYLMEDLISYMKEKGVLAIHLLFALSHLTPNTLANTLISAPAST